jgi:hypothetical protein
MAAFLVVFDVRRILGRQHNRVRGFGDVFLIGLVRLVFLAGRRAPLSRRCPSMRGCGAVAGRWSRLARVIGLSTFFWL